MSYQVENAPANAPTEAIPRQTGAAMLRGARGKCPACGRGKLFSSFLKVVHACDACGTELHHHRADDAPPYFTMLIVGHVVGGGVLTLEQQVAPSQMTHLLIWIPLTIVLSLALLTPIKGALIGLQWAQRMHGFGTGPDPASPESGTAVAGTASQVTVSRAPR